MSLETVRVIYCSTVTSELKKESFIDMVRASVANNKQLDITGILLFDGHYFFQVLEGEKEKVQSLLSKIRLDVRHKAIETLSSRAISTRLFPKWSMELINSDNDFFRETYAGNFNPYEFSDTQALDCATNAKAWRMRRLQQA
ncbi:BLUF domain-containing protein [Pseudoalteromonas sp.]|uniref:BLUF domain-containing protein n=1 Tax=Pseudoalteromonas sp. TaxID=53249 RepID=UPI00261A4883|nr:BLUF domain-containing protein [Pseudoalteromonas sp.]MCP4586586.1 BLUF domain-containing protein [Pseudoalteromonas sp.]